MSPLSRRRLTPEAYAEGVRAGDRLVLSRAITLIESRLPTDAALAQQVLEQLMPHVGQSVRVGITGVPGVGKSSFIEVLGRHLTGQGKRLAVLTVDPTSSRSQGSIMGDKTRMEQLAQDPLAYIRPSPAGEALGGVTHRTRETLLLCEAAGYEVVFIETVGVGQSETAVRSMTDFFLLLMLAGAGDELQGIKRGIMEMADGIAITKADGANAGRARLARLEYQNALHLFPPPESGWQPQVLTTSAQQPAGIAETWQMIESFVQTTRANGWLMRHRQAQNRTWMHDTIRDHLLRRFYDDARIRPWRQDLEAAVAAGEVPAIRAATELLARYFETDPMVSKD